MDFPLLSLGRKNALKVRSLSDHWLDLKEKSLPQTPPENDFTTPDDTTETTWRTATWPTKPQSLARPWYQTSTIGTFDVLLALLPLSFIVLACIAAFLNGHIIYVDGQVDIPTRPYGQNVAMFTSKYVLSSIFLRLGSSH